MNVYSQNFRFRKFKFCKTFEGIIQTRARVRVYIYIFFLGYLYLHWAILHNALIVQQFLVVFLIVSGFMNGGVGVTLGEFPRSGNVKNTKVKQGW